MMESRSSIFVAGISNLTSGVYDSLQQVDNETNAKIKESNLRIGSVRASGPFNPRPSGPLYDVKANKLQYFAFQHQTTES